MTRRRPSAHMRTIKIGKGRKLSKRIIINPHIKKHTKRMMYKTFGSDPIQELQDEFQNEFLEDTLGVDIAEGGESARSRNKVVEMRDRAREDAINKMREGRPLSQTDLNFLEGL